MLPVENSLICFICRHCPNVAPCLLCYKCLLIFFTALGKQLQKEIWRLYLLWRLWFLFRIFLVCYDLCLWVRSKCILLAEAEELVNWGAEVQVSEVRELVLDWTLWLEKILLFYDRLLPLERIWWFLVLIVGGVWIKSWNGWNVRLSLRWFVLKHYGPSLDGLNRRLLDWTISGNLNWLRLLINLLVLLINLLGLYLNKLAVDIALAIFNLFLKPWTILLECFSAWRLLRIGRYLRYNANRFIYFVMIVFIRLPGNLQEILPWHFSAVSVRQASVPLRRSRLFILVFLQRRHQVIRYFCWFCSYLLSVLLLELLDGLLQGLHLRHDAIGVLIVLGEVFLGLVLMENLLRLLLTVEGSRILPRNL